jgi:hypothetical protein
VFNVGRRDFVTSVCLQCVLLFQYKEVNGHTSGHSSGKSETDIKVSQLLLIAEGLLKKLDGNAALNIFEQAALIVHASEVEIGIVRSHMQAGQFQRALAFCAHAAGAHLDEPAPTLLYAQLLKLSGQMPHAEKLMTEYRARFKANAATSEVARLSPYFDARGLPTSAKMLGSGLVLPTGTRAVIPAVMVSARTKALWIRYGTGFLRKASVEKIVSKDGLAILKIDNPLESKGKPELAITSKPAFPGSIAYAMHFIDQMALSWPSLWSSFVGEPAKISTGRRLIDLPEATARALGASLFDQTGAAIGLLVPVGASKKMQLVPISELDESSVANELSKVNQGVNRGAKIASERIYEIGLNHSVQILGSS